MNAEQVSGHYSAVKETLDTETQEIIYFMRHQTETKVRVRHFSGAALLACQKMSYPYCTVGESVERQADQKRFCATNSPDTAVYTHNRVWTEKLIMLLFLEAYSTRDNLKGTRSRYRIK
jgi:hypothetical protein